MEDYYDIDSILAEDQNVKCVFQKNIPGLAWLEGGHDDTTVPMDIETPEFFGPKVRNALRADATTVDLTKQCPNFFRFGTFYLQLVDDMALSGVMEGAFKARLQMTMDHTQSGGNSNTTDYLNRLDETERELYKAGMESSASIHQWNQQSFGRIRSASEMLLKRKAT
ncbi:DNA replication protein [Linnemannia exigua]|uniref:DNA replication complex GINS protein PSF3 n=1 Tax=Linnemannia exigua TaxID=604196 RepID=A0AAD4H660_9FUNG|nr:DNA replication protein [Linnemannia exigua]